MFMNKIEIKIWANPQGIAEVTRKLPSVIFTDEEKALFSPDSYDPITTPDFFSIFYARNSYVVSYHFYITGSKLNFRDARTILSIAIPRGYAIRMPGESGVQPLSDTDINLYKVFVELKKKYEDLVSQLNDINGLSDALAYTVPHWIDEYSAKLVIDHLQPLINIPGTTKAKGYVLWNDSSMLQQYLEAPVRMDFNGASLMLLLPTVAEQQYAAFLRPFFPVRAEPQYRPKYSVYFPAYKREDPIAIIHSLDETIEHTFEKPYSKPIHLNGKYSDHIQDWDIKKTSDKAGFNIGLQFEEQEFRREINVTFINLNNQSVKVKRVESWLVPSVGRIVTDDNGCWLVLRGVEIDSVSQITFSSNRKDYWIRDFSFSQDLINIRVEEVFYFDVPDLKKAIECKYHFSPKIYYFQDGLMWASIDSRTPFRGDKHQYKVKLGESEEYEEAVFFMDQDFNSIELKRKPRTKLVISFKGEILIWLDADGRRSVTLQEDTGANGESRGEGHKNILMPRVVTLSDNELELPPFNGEKKISFTAPGFKTEHTYIRAKTEKLELEMQLVWWKKIQKVRLTYVLIGLLFGYILGCLLPLPFLSNSKGGQSQSTYPSYSKADSIPAGTTDDNDDTYGGAPAFQDSVNLDEQDSKQPPEIEPSKESEKSAISTKQDNSKKPDQPAPTPPAQEISPELAAIMQKLMGIEFTHADLQKARDIARKAGQLQEKEQFFKDCEFALSVATSGKNRGASYVGVQLRQRHTLQDIQKNAILRVIKDEDTFNSDTKTYSTIKAMLDAYNNQ